jgi:hypothetical protein
MKPLLRCFSLVFLAVVAQAVSAAPTVVVTPSSTTYKSTRASVTVTVNLNYGGALSALDFSLTTPAASGTWKVPSVAGPNIPQTMPEPDDLGASGLGFVYTDIPAGTANFTFALTYPAGMTGDQVLTYTANFTDESGMVSTVTGKVTLSPAR